MEQLPYYTLVPGEVAHYFTLKLSCSKQGIFSELKNITITKNVEPNRKMSEKENCNTMIISTILEIEIDT